MPLNGHSRHISVIRVIENVINVKPINIYIYY